MKYCAAARAPSVSPARHALWARLTTRSSIATTNSGSRGTKQRLRCRLPWVSMYGENP